MDMNELNICFIIYAFILYCSLVNKINRTNNLHISYVNHGVKGDNVYRQKLMVDPNTLQICQIPSLDFESHYVPVEFPKCSVEPDLTEVVFTKDGRRFQLLIKSEHKQNYAPHYKVLKCCFQIVFISLKTRKVDSILSMTACQAFQNGHVLPKNADVVRVGCKVDNVTVYSNIHVIARVRSSFKKRLNDLKIKGEQRVPSVLLMGMQGLTQHNFPKVMPKTHYQLTMSNWFTLKGYNKVDDETFLNIMAMLIGFDLVSLKSLCNPKIRGNFDKCPWIWQEFRKIGYITAYGDDDTWNYHSSYLKNGFKTQSTDFYLRPAILAGDHFFKGKEPCMGRKYRAEYVYDYANDIYHTLSNNYSIFGVFWANSFSSTDSLYSPQVDDLMLRYFQDFEKKGIRESSIIIFFSDRGTKPKTNKLSEHLNSRLPNIYISLPSWFQKKYPDAVNALKENQHRLTSPYDIYSTLKHILSFSGRLQYNPPLYSSNGQTLFIPVPLNRTCEDIGISRELCACASITEEDPLAPEIRNIAQQVVRKINELLGSHAAAKDSCQELQLVDIVNVKNIILNSGSHNMAEKKIKFVVKPGNVTFVATFPEQGTIGLSDVPDFVNCVDVRQNASDCISDSKLNPYCICKTVH